MDTEYLSFSNSTTCRAVSIHPHEAIEIAERSSLLALSNDEQSYCGKEIDSILYKLRLQTCLALREILNLPNAPINKMPNGKPYLSNRSESLTIAHKDHMIFVCVHNQGLPIGADVEDENQVRNWEPFQGRFFNHQDWLLSLRMSQLLSLEKNTAMLILFTAKEALLKCTELEIDALKMIFNLEIETSSAQNIFLTANPEWRNSIKQFSIEIKRQNNCIFAVCIESNSIELNEFE